MSTGQAPRDLAPASCPTCASSATRLFDLPGRDDWFPARQVVRCDDAACGLAFAHPSPTDAELAIAYARDFQPGTEVPEHGSTPRTYAARLVDALGRRVGSLEGRRVIDYGAGIGTIAGLLAERGAIVGAIEHNPAARDRIRADTPVAVAASLAELGEPDEATQADVIVMVEVIEHLRDPRAALAEIRPWLRPTGIVFLTTPNFASLRARLDGPDWTNVRNPVHVVYFTRRSLGRTLELAGFAGVEPLAGMAAHPEATLPRRAIQTVLGAFGLDGGIRVVATPA